MVYRDNAKCRRCGRRVGYRNLTNGLCNACRKELGLPVIPSGKRFYITRETLEYLKRKYGMENASDREFLEWWRRNRGTGYEAYELIHIIEEME